VSASVTGRLPLFKKAVTKNYSGKLPLLPSYRYFLYTLRIRERGEMKTKTKAKKIQIISPIVAINEKVGNPVTSVTFQSKFRLPVVHKGGNRPVTEANGAL